MMEQLDFFHGIIFQSDTTFKAFIGFSSTDTKLNMTKLSLCCLSFAFLATGVPDIF